MGLPSAAYTRFKSTTTDDPQLCKLIICISVDAREYQDKGVLARHIAQLVEGGYSSYFVPSNADSFQLVDAFRTYVGRRFADMHTDLHVRIDVQPEARIYPSRRQVEGLVDDALGRMCVERTSASLAWPPDAECDAKALEVFEHILELRRIGKLRHVGLVDATLDFLTKAHQQGVHLDYCIAPYNVVDSRAHLELVHWCLEHNVLFIASSMGGGLLSERFLGVPEPMRLANDAQRRFATTIAAFGGWALYQELLFCLKAIAEKYNVSIANVALRWVLQQHGVDAVILDGPLAIEPNSPFPHNERVFAFALDTDDLSAIDEVTSRGW